MKSLFKVIRFHQSTVKGGNLYTWGAAAKSQGNSEASQTKMNEVAIPLNVSGLEPNSVAKCHMGNNHSVVITTEGKLYTFGTGNYGQLGHNSTQSEMQPRLVEFFDKKNIKIVDAQCGDHHTIALAEDGDVFTWGWGGKESSYIMQLLFASVGPLGHGSQKHCYVPTPVKKLRDFKKVTGISCGVSFSSALNEDQDLYLWGKGDYGVFGNGSNKQRVSPELNDFFPCLKLDEQPKWIKKYKSCNSFSVCQLNDGSIHTWGYNESGQCGVKQELGVEFYETVQYPVQIQFDDESINEKIKDFDCGEDTLVILTENNQVFWCGQRTAYLPKKLIMPEEAGQIQAVSAGHKNLAVLGEDNKIYMKGGFVKHQSENEATGVAVADNSIFGDENGTILKIGGNYRNRFAIINQQ